jgi:hypothetical protein
MYYWLIGTMNPFLFFCLSAQLRTRINAIKVLFGLCFVILFKVLDFESLPLLSIEAKGSLTSKNQVYDHSAPELSAHPEGGTAARVFLNCVRLRGLSGQIEDKVLLFYNYKTLTRILLLPLFWILGMILELRFKLLYAEMASVLLTIISFPVEISGLGLLRVILWCGPLLIIRDFFGFYGKRALVFNLVVLSLLFPLIFEKESSLVMVAILISIHILLMDKPLFVQFLLGNLVVSLFISIAQNKLQFIEILMSPVFELVGYAFNTIRYLNLEVPATLENYGLIAWVCRPPLTQFALLVPEGFSIYFFKVLISALLLGYLKPISIVK